MSMTACLDSHANPLFSALALHDMPVYSKSSWLLGKVGLMQ